MTVHGFSFAARRVAFPAIVCLLAQLVETSAAFGQNNDAGPNFECECYQGLDSPPSFGPKNVCYLVDGRRYDISTLRFFRNPMLGVPEEELPARTEPFFDSGMYRVIPEVEIVVGPGYGYGASVSVSPEPFSQGASGGFDAEIDFVDTEPPTVGDGLRVTTRIFTNECGAQALHFEDGGTRDNFSGNINRLPVLVRIRSLARDLSFTTFSTTFGFTGGGAENVIGFYPFTGRCVGDRGLESLDFEFGEQVEVELTVYDYACNGAEPVTQTISWPIQKTAPGTGGSPGPGGANGGGVSGDGGSGGTLSGNSGGGCAAHGPATSPSRAGFWTLAALGCLLWRRQARPSDGGSRRA